MPNNIKISIIIPFFNVELYIKETLNSILKQELEDIEIILINDGSTDASLEIVRSLVDNDKRFIILEQENQGQCVARNAGLAIARGEYVFFLDADDLLSENYFANLYDVAKTNDLDLLCTDTFFLKDGVLVDSNFISEYTREAFRTKNAYKELLFIIKASVVWGKLYKRSFLQKNNLIFKKFKRFEDNYFIFNLCLQKPKIGYCFNSKIYYRIRENSIMTSIEASQKHYHEMLSILTSIDSLLGEHCLIHYSDKKNFSYIYDEMILETILTWGKKNKDYEFIELLLAKLSFIKIITNPFICIKRKIKLFKLIIRMFCLKKISSLMHLSEKHSAN